MKLLTIALDGGDRRIIEKMPMPFVHGLLRDNPTPELIGDLYSRGWAEIYTGTHATESGALYMYPVLDGTHRFTQSYNYRMSEEAGIPMLWKTLNQQGVSVGFMNIPTTSPAPEVNGFFVGGGGGGVAKTEGVPAAICDSEETRDTLDQIGYIPDLRLGGEKLTDLEDLFDRLDRIIQIRKDAFLALCAERNPDFGLLCFRVTTTIQYFAMSEIEVLLASAELADLEIGAGACEQGLNPAQRRILQHYRLLDDMIREVFKKLQPEEFLFCADHGASRYKFKANANSFLVEAGYQVSLSTSSYETKRFWVRARRKIGRLFPFVAPTFGNPVLLRFDPLKTRAFGNWYVHGIYVNDKRRFGGPVHEGEGLDRLVDEICEVFNRHPTAIQHSMKAKPFRRLHPNSQWQDRFPDILIDKPDEVFFERTEGFVTPNPNYGPVPHDITGMGDMNSGQKSRHPLFLISSGLSNLTRKDDIRDLRLVYHLIVRFFDSNMKSQVAEIGEQVE